jgi:predicted TIM-barrel fold metal-dependent hydrolase
MPGHLQALSKLIGELPDVRVALDHCGFPDLSEGRVAPDAPLLALQDAGHVSLKISSHLLRDAAATGDPVALVGQLAAAFGGERLLWGSDYPQTDSDYGALLDDAAAATRQLDVGVRTGFFSGNATQVFFAGR